MSPSPPTLLLTRLIPDIRYLIYDLLASSDHTITDTHLDGPFNALLLTFPLLTPETVAWYSQNKAWLIKTARGTILNPLAAFDFSWATPESFYAFRSLCTDPAFIKNAQKLRISIPDTSYRIRGAGSDCLYELGRMTELRVRMVGEGELWKAEWRTVDLEGLDSLRGTRDGRLWRCWGMSLRGLFW